MLGWIITRSLEHRFLVVVCALILVAVGVRALLHLPIDAFPDTTPVQVQVNTVAPALTPEEVEQQITIPVEQGIAGIPRLADVRSISKFGLSQVTATFDDGTDIYFARQLVNERLQEVDLAEGLPRPEMGPVSTGLGEIYHYIVRGEGWSLQDLTTVHDWIIKPQLLSVPGVAEVNTWGGEERQYQVLVDPSRLSFLSLTQDDVIEALRRNNLAVGGGSVTQAGELHLIQGTSLTTSIEEIGNVVIEAHEGTPLRIRDVAEVTIGHEIRRGAATANGQGEIVLGLAFMLMGENSHEVTERLENRMDEVRRTLPAGVEVVTVYERSHLVEQVIGTVEENLALGAILVMAVLFVFLGSVRAGLIVASAIPLSMLFAFDAMVRTGIAGSLLSLGALDFGLIVDGAVIVVENAVRHGAHGGTDRRPVDVVREAAIEVLRPAVFGVLIITIVYLPILTLEGIEGKLFRPMALTVIFALAGSLVLSLTLIPCLTSLALPRHAVHRENLIVRGVRWVYRPLVRGAIRMRWLVIPAAAAILAGGAYLGSRTGSEFVPRLQEMGIVINTVRLSGVSLDESVRYGTQLERAVRALYPDEVKDVWVRTGTAEVATDPMGIELSDCFITLTPRERWARARTQEELVDLMSRELQDLPGTRLIFTQPIEMRVNEMIAGIRTDLGVKIFGDDLETLKTLAQQVGGVLRTIPGSADVYVEQITGQPIITVRVDQDAIARHGVPAEEVLEVVAAIGGIPVGEIREGQRRFDLVVRLAEEYRENPDAIGGILIPTVAGERIPLRDLATIEHAEGPSTITREWQRRRIVVQTNVRGRDVASFVEEARRRIEAEIPMPAGYRVAYGGEFEHLLRARSRLALVVPAALTLIFLLLAASTGSAREATLIFTGAPFAAVGGILALWLRGMPFTISAAVGFVAVSGVAMLAGLVLVSTIRQLTARGADLHAAIEEAASLRLRPILMTTLVASLGFVPMALNTGVGAEVQRPLASVVLGGVISANVLTLLVLPALYAAFGPRTGSPPPPA